MIKIVPDRYEESDKKALIDSKAHQYGRNLASSDFDLIGKNVDFRSGEKKEETIDILLVRFGDSPLAQINNYFLEPVPEELSLDDDRYESRKALLPNSEWNVDPRQVRVNRDFLVENSNTPNWDFCYTYLNENQFESFSKDFLGHDPEYWNEREWASYRQEYF